MYLLTYLFLPFNSSSPLSSLCLCISLFIAPFISSLHSLCLMFYACTSSFSVGTWIYLLIHTFLSLLVPTHKPITRNDDQYVLGNTIVCISLFLCIYVLSLCHFLPPLSSLGSSLHLHYFESPGTYLGVDHDVSVFTLHPFPLTLSLHSYVHSFITLSLLQTFL